MYKLCFANRVSSQQVKQVAFTVHVGDKLYQDIATHEHVTPLEQEVLKLQESLSAIQDE